MRFEDERYTRVYNRKTTTIKMIGWEGRAVWRELLLEFDRAGIFDLSGEDPVTAVSAVTEIPEDVVSRGLARLIERRCVLHIPEQDCLYAPKFFEAQEARQSDRARKAAQRAKVRAKMTIEDRGFDKIEIEDDEAEITATSDVTQRDTWSQGVTGSEEPSKEPVDEPGHATGQLVTQRDHVSHIRTKGHTESHGVTPVPTVPSLPSPSRTVGESIAPGVPKIRRQHPDGLFAPQGDIPASHYVPSDWLAKDATEKGVPSDIFGRKLSQYRQRAEPQFKEQGAHDSAFAGFLQTALKDLILGGPNGQAGRRTAQGGGSSPGRAGAEQAATRGAGAEVAGPGSESRRNSPRDVRHRKRSRALLDSFDAEDTHGS